MGGLRINSSWITMYAFLVHAIECELMKHCKLTLTQYRVLLMLTQTQDFLRAGEIAKMINLKPSTITEAVNQLTQASFASREYNDEDDLRSVHIKLTDRGIKHVATADKVLVALIEKIWGKEYGVATRKIIFQQAAESVLYSGQARIEKRGVRADTAYLISVFIGFSDAEIHARTNGISLLQYRVLLRLSEEEKPMRCGDIAYDLLLKPNAVSTASDTLIQRNLLKRERGEDRRSVFLTLSESGKELSARITEEITQARMTRSPRCSMEDNEEFLVLAREMIYRQRGLSRGSRT